MSEILRTFDNLRGELQRLREDPTRDPSRVKEILVDNLIEVADNIADFEDPEKEMMLDLLEPELQADFLEEMDEKDQAHFLELLSARDGLAAVMSEMKADDIADILDDVPAEQRQIVLDSLPEERAEEIRGLAAYDPDTAGGLMTTEFLAVPEDTTVRQVKDLIRTRGEVESVGNIFVTAEHRLLGVFSIRQLILADNEQEVAEFMERDVIAVEVDDDAEECYRVMETYHLASIPVVDEYHDLLGIVTFDDVLTVGEREASEDVFKMAGSADLYPTRDSVLGRVKKRIGWLVVSIGGGFVTAFIIGLFGVGDKKIVSDAVRFMPMIVMLGGNIATQCSATMVRGFATGEIESRKIRGVIFGELAVGLVLGLALSFIGGALAYLLGDRDALGLAVVVLSSIICLSLIAATLGTIIPALCERIAVDPAISAGPFITMLIDMVGAVVYLSFVLAFRIHG
ncbi:MAG: magnesium transporter [Planctomycetes bacterium]|nr:magnesium transporter [Planctomycetota bacterium]